jgi:hypothetical protein
MNSLVSASVKPCDRGCGCSGDQRPAQPSKVHNALLLEKCLIHVANIASHRTVLVGRTRLPPAYPLLTLALNLVTLHGGTYLLPGVAVHTRGAVQGIGDGAERLPDPKAGQRAEDVVPAP